MANDESGKGAVNVDVLAKRVTEPEDLFEVGNDLIALESVDRLRARDAALTILYGQIGDVYYRAFAFEILYEISLDDGIAYIEQHASDESAYVLGAMLTSVAEDAGRVEERDKIVKAVTLLRRELARRPAEELKEISEKRVWFDKTYLQV